VFVLLGLELLRQVHFLISEHSARYHRFWTETFFGSFERTTHRRISDWTRFRIRRILTWILWIAIIAVVTGKIIHTSPILALLRGPQLIWHVLPFVLQIVFLLLIVVGQFAAIFWFMSRGGVDVYYPDDIKTSFPTSGARTTCSSGSRRTSSSWRTPSWWRSAAATCRAACCCGGRREPARR